MAANPMFQLLLRLNDLDLWDKLPFLVTLSGVNRSILSEGSYQRRVQEMRIWCLHNCKHRSTWRGDPADRPHRDVAFKFEDEAEAALFKMRFL